MKRIISIMAAVLFGVLAGCGNAPSTAHVPAVTPFEVRRYLGTWHEAARLPHRFEKGLTGVTAHYELAPDGSITVVNRGYRNGRLRVIRGVARQTKKNAGELEVSFFRPFYGAYRVIALDGDYSAALVTSSTMDYAWILVRDPARIPALLPEYLAQMKALGFDCSKLEFPAR